MCLSVLRKNCNIRRSGVSESVRRFVRTVRAPGLFRFLEVADGVLEFVAAARIAESDDLAAILRQ